jgi:hypothetical protein
MKPFTLSPFKKTIARASATALVACMSLGAAVEHAAAATTVSFDMVRSPAAVKSGCLAGAKAHVTIVPLGAVEQLIVKAEGLPPDTDFDLFVIQVPDAPFGMSWYQGDFETNSGGAGVQVYAGRFSEETFIVAPGPAPAPVVFTGPFPDASSNPPTNPIQMYHIGMWFDSPADAAKAGCPGTVTPFNGEHNAGVQILNTANFPVNSGPLRQVK